MTVRFPERFDRHNRSVKVQPFDFTIDQRSLSYLNRLAAKCDFIRFSDWNQTVRNSFQVSTQQSHFNRAPFGTSSPNVAITGLPSSPTDAASSIPWDS